MRIAKLSRKTFRSAFIRRKLLKPNILKPASSRKASGEFLNISANSDAEFGLSFIRCIKEGNACQFLDTISDKFIISFCMSSIKGSRKARLIISSSVREGTSFDGTRT